MESKFKIIETPGYVLAVSDKHPTVSNQLIYESDTNTINTTGSAYTPNAIDFLIAAYKPKGNAPELDLPLLPKIVIEDDVEKLAESYKNKKGSIPTTELEDEIFKLGFKDGHKAATKVYSEEDMREAFEYGKQFSVEDFGSKYFEEFIQSLKQPTPKWFVAEAELREINPNADRIQYLSHLKTTTINGKQVLVGKYLYE
jgi:hypothetical protein